MIHPISADKQPPTTEQMEAVARAKISELSQAADELLAETADADLETAELLRAECTRLASANFALVRMLCHGRVQDAYRLASGGPDQNGDVLGVVA